MADLQVVSVACYGAAVVLAMKKVAGKRAEYSIQRCRDKSVLGIFDVRFEI